MEFRKIIVNKQEIELPRKEFDLFCLLASNPGQIFTYEQIYREVWGYDCVGFSDNSLNSCLRRIRKRFSEIENLPGRIENCWGVGYRYVKFDNKREK